MPCLYPTKKDQDFPCPSPQKKLPLCQIFKTMKKLYLLGTLALSGLGWAQIVNIPDANFKKKLLEANSTNSIAKNLQGNYFKIDANGDGEIQLSEAQNVSYLGVYSSSISSLVGIEAFINITNLYCSNNQLTSLDLSKLTNLTLLDCSNNKLTTLDISAAKKLQFLYCANNQLVFLNIKNGVISLRIMSSYDDMSDVDFNHNPNLKYICCDDGEINTIIANAYTYFGLKNVSINSYCSFTPGGQFYSIKGQNKLALTGACDSSSPAFPNVKFNISNGTANGSFISDPTGTYSLPVQAGSHTLTPVAPKYFSVSPSQVSVSFPSTASPLLQDFCITPNGTHNDVEVMVSPISPAQPGFEASYKITYKNKGNQMLSGSVSFAYDEDRQDFISSTKTPDSNNNQGKLTWDYSDLKPFEERSINVVLKTNKPTETPSVVPGNILPFTAIINPITGDETPADNTFVFKQTVVGSYDPNDKTCLEGSSITPEMVGKDVHYTIRFENTGDYQATNVVVKDMIDTTKFDVASLQVLEASHNFYTKISDTNKVEFIFENINLPFAQPASMGHLSFKIKTLPTVKIGDELKNTADIFFDYNLPIITNTAKTVVEAQAPLSTSEVSKAVDFALFPNPASSVLNVISKTEIKHADVLDAQGRLIQSSQIKDQKIDIERLEKGAYFLRINNKMLKFIKE
jgi:uncharacterized repeat protein (TIGR01451 family)